LKILTKNINATPLSVAKIVGIHISTKEITSIVFEFIDWLHEDDTTDDFDAVDCNGVVEWFYIDEGKSYTKEQMFQYWWNNVKNK